MDHKLNSLNRELTNLDILHKSGLISDEEYASKWMDIVDRLGKLAAEPIKYDQELGGTK